MPFLSGAFQSHLKPQQHFRIKWIAMHVNTANSRMTIYIYIRKHSNIIKRACPARTF